MRLRVLLVDDEQLARVRLRTLLAGCKTPQASVEAEAANATQSIEWLQRQQFDVALVDIHMPGADGVTLACAMRDLPNPPLLVFVTAHAEHAVQAFELEALDYLTKPVRLERLQLALEKVERLVGSRRSDETDVPEQVLVIQERGRTERVPLSEILYLKAELKYITVRTANSNWVMEGSLSDIETKFPDRFLRIHRNALVSRHSVRAIERQLGTQDGEGWVVRLNGVSDLLQVSRRQLATVRELVSNLCS